MLLFDMGVQLSFLAVGTLVTIHTPFTGKARAKATVDLPVNSSEKQKNHGFTKSIPRSLVKVTLKSMYLSTALFAVTARFSLVSLQPYLANQYPRKSIDRSVAGLCFTDKLSSACAMSDSRWPRWSVWDAL